MWQQPMVCGRRKPRQRYAHALLGKGFLYHFACQLPLLPYSCELVHAHGCKELCGERLLNVYWEPEQQPQAKTQPCVPAGGSCRVGTPLPRTASALMRPIARRALLLPAVFLLHRPYPLDLPDLKAGRSPQQHS